MLFNERLNIRDRIIIITMIARKLFRGMCKCILLKKVQGPLFIGKHVSLTHGKCIICGKNVKFEDYSEIHGLCKEGIIFGNNVTISRGVMIRPSSYYGKNIGSGLLMGDCSSIGPYGYVGCAGKIVIGNNVMIGPNCSLIAENHLFSNTQIAIKNQGVMQKGIIIEDDCWIGNGVIILDGVTIGRGSVVGAGTVVSKNIISGSVIYDKREKVVHKR
jgi:acetyltransferase-like isoleucine patch superfamily enzyme